MSDRTALVGWSGFVGGNLLAQARFDDRYRREDVEGIADQDYGLVVCAGLPAEKWRINQDPATDLANLERLEAALGRARIHHLVVISTVDVYPDPSGVDESTPIDESRLQPYGLHRRMFERWALERFDTTVVRLPGLFGTGLKKNAIFDLIHANRLDLLHADSSFQFYPLERLWTDIGIVLEHGIPVANLATEPVTVAEVGEAILGRPFDGRPTDRSPVAYDMRTTHAAAFGREGSYLLTRLECLEGIRAFAQAARAGN